MRSRFYRVPSAIFGRMSPADIAPSISYSDLTAIVDQHHEPWESVAQCDVFLRAAQMLRRREPSEAEKDGMRYSKRDLESAIVQCRKQRAVLALCSRPTEVIVPPDELR